MASPPTPAGPASAGRRAVPGSIARRLAAVAVTAVCCGVGAWLGAWWVPFAVGVGAGLPGPGLPGTGRWRARRGGVLPVLAGAVLGWLTVLWALALDGQPAGATARTVAALAGLPPYAWLTVLVVALLAALQVLAGGWLARAVLPRSAREPQAGAAGDPQA